MHQDIQSSCPIKLHHDHGVCEQNDIIKKEFYKKQAFFIGQRFHHTLALSYIFTTKSQRFIEGAETPFVSGTPVTTSYPFDFAATICLRGCQKDKRVEKRSLKKALESTSPFSAHRTHVVLSKCMGRRPKQKSRFSPVGLGRDVRQWSWRIELLSIQPSLFVGQTQFPFKHLHIDMNKQYPKHWVTSLNCNGGSAKYKHSDTSSSILTTASHHSNGAEVDDPDEKVSLVLNGFSHHHHHDFNNRVYVNGNGSVHIPR